MSNRINLADPDFEPSDEDLQELSRRAFAHVAREKEESLRQLRQRIARGQAELYKRIMSAQENAS